MMTPPPGRTNSVQVAVEALVAMATPTKEESLVHGCKDDNKVTLSSDNESEMCYQLAQSADTAQRKKKDDVICNGQGRRSKSRSPPSGVAPGTVSVDGEGLVRVFERVVRGTEGCSIVEMERIHTTYQQLVFRHRMSWQRDALLEVSLAPALFPPPPLPPSSLPSPFLGYIMCPIVHFEGCLAL